ncbi:hypothetical protein BVI2075_480024 [Burkholderia vietnamiensis]|nr:hypothetical protein BVI2075_480024 [Burkholderia vietnamiensis]
MSENSSFQKLVRIHSIRSRLGTAANIVCTATHVENVEGISPVFRSKAPIEFESEPRHYLDLNRHPI